MTDEGRVSDLLLRWQQGVARGREESVEALCHDCPNLADELRRRIGILRRLGDVVRHLNADSTDEPFACPPTIAPSLPGYEVLGELGRGGMGVVYKARQVGLDRTVAVKVILSPDADDVEQRQRFRREAEAVAALHHPNVVHLHTCGEAGGHLYLVLEYLEGGSLAERCGGRPLPPAQAARLVEVVARAVHACHEQGVVHRDLKPANILLGSGGVPKVADFGLARRAGAPAHTRTGAVLGTPSYMAPEQAEGRSKDAGRPCDVYALGAILYECLTGRPPFKAETSLDTLILVLTEEPTPPSEVQRGVPASLETICLCCLRKDPGRRYRSALDLADDLARFQRGEPIRGTATGGAVKVRRSLRAVVLGAGGLAAACVAVCLLVLGWGRVPWNAEDVASGDGPDRPPAGHGVSPPMPDGDGDGPGKTPPHPPAVSPEPPVAVSFLQPIAQVPLGHGVTGVAFVGDGKQFACAGSDGSLRIRHARDGEEVRRLAGHTGRVHALAVSPDRARLLSASEDDAVKLWNVGGGIPIKVGSGAPADAVAFGPDRTRFVTGDASGTVRLWGIGTGREFWRASLGDAPVRCVAVSPEGNFVAAGGERGWLGWADTGRECFTPAKHSGVRAVAFSPDGAVFAMAGGPNQWTVVWETSTGLPRFTLPVRARSLAFSPDGWLLAVGGQGEPDVRVYSRLSGKEVVRCSAGPKGDAGTRPYQPARLREVQALAFAPDRPLLLGGSEDGRVLMWDVGPVARTVRKQVALDPAKVEEQRLALATDDGPTAAQAVQALAVDPKVALELLGSDFRPVVQPDLGGIEDLVRANRPKVRAAGLAELEGAGELAESALRDLLGKEWPPDLRAQLEGLQARIRGPVTTSGRLRALRGLEVLHLIGATEGWATGRDEMDQAAGVREARAAAWAKIGQLAEGAPGAHLTRRARTALQRHREWLLFAE